MRFDLVAETCHTSHANKYKLSTPTSASFYVHIDRSMGFCLCWMLACDMSCEGSPSPL